MQVFKNEVDFATVLAVFHVTVLAVVSFYAGYVYCDELFSWKAIILFVLSAVMLGCVVCSVNYLLLQHKCLTAIIRASNDYVAKMAEGIKLKDELIDEFEELIITGQEIRMPPEYWSNERVARVKARLDKKVEQGLYRKVVLPENPLLPFEEWL